MIKSYLLVAVRNFWRNKTFSAINVMGLAIGISASLVLFLIVYYEFSFDKFEKDSDSIFRVVMEIKDNGESNYSAAVPAPLANAAATEITGIEQTVPLLQFQGDASWQSLGLTGEELVDIETDPQLRPQSQAALIVRRPDGSSQEVKLTLRIDTPIEVDYYRHGGILPYVLRQLLAA